jgi:hypothetical protein
MKELSHIMGYRFDGTEADARELGRVLPMVALVPERD